MHLRMHLLMAAVSHNKRCLKEGFKGSNDRLHNLIGC